MNKKHHKIMCLRIALTVSMVPILLLGDVAWGESADDLFSEGMKAYENGEYQLSIDKLAQALPLLKEDRERIEAFKTMAFAYMAFPKKDEAREQFCNILKIDPTFGLDPMMTSPKILAVFQEAKERCILFGGIKVQAISRDKKAIHGAKVYLNKNLIGETPLQKEDILPGKYELEVRKDGFRPFQSPVSVEAMVIIAVKSTLVPMKIPTIASIGHNVSAPLLPDDRIEVTLKGDSGRTATFDLGNFKKDLPMQEVSPGRYVGLYRIGKKDQFAKLHIFGHLEDQYGGRASMKAAKPIAISRLSRSQLLFRRGKASLERGELDSAIDSLTKALYEDSKLVEAHILLAKAYNKKKGAYLESLKYLKNAIEIDGDNLEAQSLLAEIYIENGRHESAMPVVKRILEIDPTSGLAHGYMGEILHHQGKYNEAIATLRKSLLLGKENPRVYFLLGDAFERLDRVADAVLELETAVELSPTTYQYRDTLAACYKALGQKLAAIRHWEKCLDLGDLTEVERKKVNRKLSELRR